MHMYIGIFVIITALLPASIAGPAYTGRKVVATTQHNGQTIDWIDRASQGDVAAPPPARPETKLNKIESNIEVGPAGTVPVLRQGSLNLPPKQNAFLQLHRHSSGALAERTYANDHWYAMANYAGDTNGGGAIFNVWDPYVEESTDFSLLQLGCAHGNVPDGKQWQTAEAGVMHCPSFEPNGPFLFTYFTTNDYTQTGDNLGGYNADQQGWVQYSSTVFPGMYLTNISSFGGVQAEVNLLYELYQGNWWLYFNEEPIGYYPGSVYSAGIDPSQSLAAYATSLGFWSEVFNSEDAETTTDMGSGNFPNAGYGQAAYIRNIEYLDSNNDVNIFASNGNLISDSSRYNLITTFNSDTSWASYMYLGGPGAGGVVGG